MNGVRCVKMFFSAFLFFYSVTFVYADDTFEKLFASGNYQGVIDYADEKIAIADRDANIWVKIAKANIALGMNEKALACFLVSWRLNPKDYQSLLGCAKVYNNLNQPNNAIEKAKNALDLNFTTEASWEYARACIALNRSADAKTALEKVIQADPLNSIANKELGNIYYNEKNYSKAVPLLKKEYKLDPNELSAYKLGKSYIEAGEADSAIVYLKEAVSKGAQTDYYIDLSHAYCQLNDFESAVSSFSKIPQDHLIAADLFKFAKAKESFKGIAEAIKLYESAIDKSGNEVSTDIITAHEKIARYCLQKKEYDRALNHLLSIVENDPKAETVSDLYFLTADVYIATNNNQKAISNLEKTIEINKRNVEAYAKLADLYEKAGKADKAKSVLEAMLSLSPKDPGVYLNLGQYNLKVNKYSDALAMYDKSIALKNSAEAFEGKAIAEFNLKQIASAKTSASRALQMKSSLIEARIILGKILFSENDFKRAAEALEYATYKKADMENFKMLAKCYVKIGNKEKLVEIDKKIANLDDKNIESRLRLAKDAEEKRNLAGAITLNKELLALAPDDSQVIYKLYELSNANKDLEWAMIYIKKFLAKSPDNAEAHGALGDLYYADKKNDDALAEYRAALKLNPAAKGFLKNYAEIVIAKGLQDEVINALSTLITSGEADVGTYMTLGLIYEKKKMNTNAIEMYHSALQKEPSNVDALTSLAGCQAAIGDVNGAIISYEQVIMMNNKAVNEYRELGSLYLRSFKNMEAMTAFRKYLERDSNDLEIAKFVGNDAYKNKDYKAAVKYLGMLGVTASDEDLYEYADASQLNNDTAKMIIALEKLKSRKLKTPMRIKVLGMLADAYERYGKNEETINILNKLILLPAGNSMDNLYKKAFVTEKIDPADAIKLYEDNGKMFPADYRNFLRLGVLYSKDKNELYRAVNMLKRVTELAETVPVVWFELGKVYVKIGKDSEAIKAFKKYAETDPQNLEVNSQIGILLVKSGKVNEGLVYLEIANTIQPNDPLILANLAKGYIATKRDSEGLELLLKVKDKAANNPEIQYELYEIYSRMGQKEKAQSEIKSLAESTNDRKYILYYVKSLLDNGKVKDAQDAIENILAIDAENVDALMLKAQSLRAEKKYDAAIEIYKELSYIKLDYASGFFERAETHLLQNKIQWAETFFKKALESDPKFALAEVGLAKIAKLRKDTTACKLHLESALQLDPDNDQIREELMRARN